MTDDRGDRGALDETLHELMQLFERLPFVSGLARDLRSIKGLLYERRAPRIAAIGQGGSGKSSLLDALLGAQVLAVDEQGHALPGGWIRVESGGSRVDWLEITLGGDAAEQRPGASLQQAVDEMAPDCVLFVTCPDEIDAGLGATLDEALGLVRMLSADREGGAPPVLGVLTRGDEGSSTGHSAETRIALELEEQRLQRLLQDAGLAPKEVIAVDARPPAESHAEPHHGVEQLADTIFAQLPDRAQVEGARAFVHARRARHQVARTVVYSCSALAATVAITPVPLSDIWVLGLLQVVMVSALVHLSGRSWNRKAVSEWIGSLGVVGTAGFGFRWTAQQLCKLVPGAGSLVSAGVASTGTVALGRSAMAYFIDRSGEQERRTRRRVA